MIQYHRSPNIVEKSHDPQHSTLRKITLPPAERTKGRETAWHVYEQEVCQPITNAVNDPSNFEWNHGYGFLVTVLENWIARKWPRVPRSMIFDYVVTPQKALKDGSRLQHDSKQRKHKPDDMPVSFWQAQAVFYGLKVYTDKEDIKRRFLKKIKRQRLRMPKWLQDLHYHLKPDANESRDYRSVQDEDAGKQQDDDSDCVVQNAEQQIRLKTAFATADRVWHEMMKLRRRQGSGRATRTLNQSHDPNEAKDTHDASVSASRDGMRHDNVKVAVPRPAATSVQMLRTLQARPGLTTDVRVADTNTGNGGSVHDHSNSLYASPAAPRGGTPGMSPPGRRSAPLQTTVMLPSPSPSPSPSIKKRNYKSNHTRVSSTIDHGTTRHSSKSRLRVKESTKLPTRDVPINRVRSTSEGRAGGFSRSGSREQNHGEK